MTDSHDPFRDPLEPMRRQVRDAMAPLRRAAEQAQKAMREATLPLQRAHEQLERLSAQLPPPAAVIKGLEELRGNIARALEAAMPHNWEDLSPDEHESALTFGAETGINTIWAPRGEIVKELLAAGDDDARDQLLLDREPQILHDLEAELALATHPSLVNEVRLASKALVAHRAGHAEAAHALTASVLSGLVHDAFGFERFGEARERFIKDNPNHVGLQLARITALLQIFGRALHRTDRAPGPGFNRHATAHGHPGQYTQVNAIAAHMLVVGLLRELDFWFKREDADHIEEEAA